MAKKIVNSNNAPAAVGPYSHSALADSNSQILLISGQLGLDPVSGDMQPDVVSQAEQALKNLGSILKEAGMDYSDVAKTTVFLKDMGDFAAINEVYGKYFTENPPARSCIAVAALPKDGLFEVEAIAVK